MHDRIPFHLELAGESATMYVHGRLDHATCATMAEVCDSLPQEVRALRVDLRAIGAMTDEVAAAVRLLLTRWRDGRRGEFRLTASHLTAVSRPVAVAPPFGSGPAEYVRDPMALAPL